MKLIVANWKMNGSLKLLREGLEKWQNSLSDNQIVLCPPAVFLDHASALIHQKNFFIGGQDCHSQLQGAYTGNTSAAHLKEVDCHYVIVGHSERRQGHSETNSVVKLKAEIAIKAGLRPILCVGETLEQKEQGITLEILKQQLDESLPDNNDFIIAYEPVWAIGTGKVATLEEIEEVHAFIKQYFKQEITLLYGGSVTVDNYQSILDLPTVDGVLIGGASLKIDDFNKIIHYNG